MKLITNRSGSFLTGTEIADAVMHYTLTLSKRQDVDMISIPVIDEAGQLARWQVIIGWLTDTSTSTAADRSDGELVEVDTIVGLYDRAVGAATRAEAFTDEELYCHDWATFDSEFGL